jgi:TrmH RNA methyltransferase
VTRRRSHDADRLRHGPPAPRASDDDRAASDLECVFGLRAAVAVFERRREDIVRVAFGAAVRREAASIARWAASQRVPCVELPDAEIARVAATAHHEGLCVLARKRRWTSPGELADALLRARGTALALDRVRNPYNIGAILRSAAFFGIDAVILGAPAPHPALPPDAVRVAEGGAEHVMLTRTTDLADTLARLRSRSVAVVGTDARAEADVIGYPFVRPMVAVLGHEREGLSERVRAQCDAVAAIRGRGAIESLNVGITAGLVAAELVRRASG